MSDEQKGYITITVPYMVEPTGFRDGSPVTYGDGKETFVGAVRDGQAVIIAHNDIGKAVLDTWPIQPTKAEKKARDVLAAFDRLPRDDRGRIKDRANAAEDAVIAAGGTREAAKVAWLDTLRRGVDETLAAAGDEST